MLQPYEILDRLEILNPLNIDISDLRRSYVDKDINSIFRLLKNTQIKGSSDDLRKAMVEDNLYSFFRLLPEDFQELRKFILEDNIYSFWKLITMYTDTYFVKGLKSLFIDKISYDTTFLSRGQLQSKLWLINELDQIKKSLGTVFICAGWYGSLSLMLFEKKFDIVKIRCFDKDDSCRLIAENLNKKWVMDNWKFKSITQDVLEINYTLHNYEVVRKDGSKCELVDSPDTIINTSCEHIHNFNNWYDKIPEGKLVILQSNNYIGIKDHVNCSISLENFAKQTPFSTVLFSGELELEKYTRFMRIGIK